jgi:HPt (histidine-containing phosphotransfer) domain-containing protein
VEHVDAHTTVFGADETWALFDGDVDAVRELIALVVADLPGYIRKLQASVASGDHATAARDAHRIKGTVLNVGAATLAELCEAAEQAARQRSPALAGLIERMSRESDVLVTALHAWDQTLAGAAADGGSGRV